MASVIGVMNRKGGTAKTATTVNLGAALAGMGRRVLMIDVDPSGDMTSHVGVELNDGDSTVFEVIMGEASAQSAIRRVDNETTGTHYDVIPADGALENLVGQPQESLRDAVTPIASQYDYILLDGQPAFGAATAQLITAADSILIPAGPNYPSLEAVDRTAEIIRNARLELNPDISIIGVVLTQYNPRIGHQRFIRDAMADMIPEGILDVYISSGTAVAEAAASGTDLYEYIAQNRKRRNTRAAEQYRMLAQTIIDREEN